MPDAHPVIPSHERRRVIAWALVCVAVAFALKLAWGMHVPICLLASMLVACFFREAKRLRFAAACVVVAAAAIGSAHAFRPPAAAVRAAALDQRRLAQSVG
jgi:hypothetical protein